MPKFYVHRPEVHISIVAIEAKNAEEALSLVKEGEGDEHILEYSHTLDDGWVVKETAGFGE